jgi:hypothetical protein
MKAITTRYHGYRFRSRVEARWGVYFYQLGIKFDYEPEGFDLGSQIGPYLPDFWLPQVKMWAEVKADKFSPLESAKCDALARQSGFPVLMLDGQPDITRSFFAKLPTDECGSECDYLIDSQFLCEDRFFSDPSLRPGESAAAMHSADAKRAMEAALSARFEFGESGESNAK